MPQPRVTVFQRLIRWRFLFVVNVLILFFLGMTFGREYIRTREIQKEIERLEAEANELASRNISLSELKTAVQTESYIEREARLKLGMKKPGEEVVVIQEIGAGIEEGEQGETTQDKTDPLGLVSMKNINDPQVANATKWWYYFFDKTAFNGLREK